MLIWLNLRCWHNCESWFCCELTLHKQKKATFGLRYYKKHFLLGEFTGSILPVGFFQVNVQHLWRGSSKATNVYNSATTILWSVIGEGSRGLFSNKSFSLSAGCEIKINISKSSESFNRFAVMELLELYTISSHAFKQSKTERTMVD